MGDFFHQGGWGMFPTALFGFLLVASSVLRLLRPQRRWPIAPLVLATLAAGALGTCTGLLKSYRYLEQVPVEDRVLVGALGTAESLNNLVLALVLVIPAALLAAYGTLRGAPASEGAVR